MELIGTGFGIAHQTELLPDGLYHWQYKISGSTNSDGTISGGTNSDGTKIMKTTQCPSDELIAAFAAGKLIDEVSENVADHFDQCQHCVERLQMVDCDNDGLGRLIRKAGDVSLLSNDDLQALRSETIEHGDTRERSNDHSTTPETLPEKFTDRYDVLGEIGHGGIGLVARARDVDLGRELAIKVLRKRHVGQGEIVQRFLEEARIIGQLQHPGVVPVHEMGHSIDGRPFFSMKLVNGHTLNQVMENLGTDPDHRRKLLNIMLSVCQTVAFAHSKNVVHRDLKPINIMVGEFGEVQVLDWGLAKRIGRDNESPTNKKTSDADADTHQSNRSNDSTINSMDGTVIGTPAYMPPEQAKGLVDKTGKQADVFSLGAILLEVLTGKPPYGGESKQEQLHAAETADMQGSLDRLEGESIDEELKSIVRACLQPTIEDRPSDAGVVAEKLENYLQSVESRLQQAQISAAAAESRTKQEIKTRRVTVALISFVAVTLFLTAFSWFWYRQNQRLEAIEINQQITTALGDAERVLINAERDPLSVPDLPAGQAAIQLAKSISQSPLTDEDVRRNVVLVSQRYADLLNDRELLIEFERLRRGPVGEETEDGSATFFDWQSIDSGLVNLLQQMGIDLQSKHVEDTVSILKTKPAYLQEEIINGIDSWSVRIDNKERHRFWVDVLNQVDPSDARRELRDQNHARRDPSIESQALDSIRPDESSESIVIATALIFTASGNYSKAIDVYESAIPYFPTSYWIHRDFAHNLMYANSKRYQDVASHLAIAAACRSDSTMAKLELLGGLNYAKEFAEAIIVGQSLLSELEHAPAKARALRLIADSYQNLGDLREAAECFEQAISVSDDRPATHKRLAGVYLELGLNREFERECRIVVDNNPDDAVWHYNLGNSLLRQHKYSEANRNYEACLKLDPKYVMAVMNNAQAMMNMGKFNESRQLFESVVTDHSTTKWVASAKKFLNQLNQLESLQKELTSNTADELKSLSPAKKLEMARCCYLIGDYQMSVQLYGQILEDPGNKLLIQNNMLYYHSARDAVAAAFSSSSNDEDSLRHLDIAYKNISTEFEIRQEMIKEQPQFRRQYALMLRQWQDEPKFKSVRDGKLLDTLDQAERRRWETFWKDVQTAFESNWNDQASK